MLATPTFARVTIMDKPVFEKDIPLEAGPTRRSKYYWLADMKVGDSFTCSHQDKRGATQLQYYNYRGKKKLPVWLPDGFKLATKRIGDDLYRVWRVA
jgi:hypothetical protein